MKTPILVTGGASVSRSILLRTTGPGGRPPPADQRVSHSKAKAASQGRALTSNQLLQTVCDRHGEVPHLLLVASDSQVWPPRTFSPPGEASPASLPQEAPLVRGTRWPCAGPSTLPSSGDWSSRVFLLTQSRGGGPRLQEGGQARLVGERLSRLQGLQA